MDSEKEEEDKVTTQSIDPVVTQTIISVGLIMLQGAIQAIAGWISIKVVRRIVAWWKGRNAKRNAKVLRKKSKSKT